MPGDGMRGFEPPPPPRDLDRSLGLGKNKKIAFIVAGCGLLLLLLGAAIFWRPQNADYRYLEPGPVTVVVNGNAVRLTGRFTVKPNYALTPGSLSHGSGGACIFGNLAAVGLGNPAEAECQFGPCLNKPTPEVCVRRPTETWELGEHQFAGQDATVDIPLAYFQGHDPKAIDWVVVTCANKANGATDTPPGQTGHCNTGTGIYKVGS